MKLKKLLDDPSAIDRPEVGLLMHKLVSELWPITRSITGPGVRETLEILRREIPELTIQSIPSGTKCFDWTVPEEWSITEAFIENEAGNRIVDFKNNNLHVVGYSVPVDEWLDLPHLQAHLHSLPDQPNAIPYVTSYYSRRWGFCMTHEQRQSLQPGRYRAVVQSELKPGVLNYGEVILPGNSDGEVLLSTYICHPSMANNELSGPVVLTAITAWLTSFTRRKYTYRILFIPETIGAITYLSMNVEQMKSKQSPDTLSLVLATIERILSCLHVQEILSRTWQRCMYCVTSRLITANILFSTAAAMSVNIAAPASICL